MLYADLIITKGGISASSGNRQDKLLFFYQHTGPDHIIISC